MSFETIKTEVKDHIGFITFNRPDQLNTFNSQLAREFNQSLEEFENSNEVRVIVVAGQGKAFCAGIDVNELAGKKNLDYYRWVKKMEEMSLRISKLGTPVI